MFPKNLALDQCALYKVRSPKHLAKILLLDQSVIESLADAGRANYHVFKAPSGDRWIEGPRELLKVVQRRINRLLAQVSPPDFLHSGVKGRCAVSNALRHLEQHPNPVPTVRLDVVKFYQNSDGNRVARFFLRTMQCSSEVADLLAKLTTVSATRAAKHVHLPTGGVTSQLLAYYCYEKMFQALAKLAAGNGCILGVMVDDMAISGSNATGRVLNQARMIMRHFELRSNEEKERVWAANVPKLITGVALTKKGARLPNTRRFTIHQLYRSLRNRSHSTEERALLAQRLLGHLYSAGQIEPCFTEQGRALNRKLRMDQPVWQAMHERSKPGHNPDRLNVSGIQHYRRSFTTRSGKPGFQAGLG